MGPAVFLAAYAGDLNGIFIRTAATALRRWPQWTVGSAVVAAVIAKIVLLQHATHSVFYAMAQQVSSQVKSDHQSLMLGKYWVDLPFYLHLSVLRQARPLDGSAD